MAASPVLIKKYGDRRLYDTRRKRYVTLQDIAGMIRNGEAVEVRDSRTGEDLTRIVLMQIVMEEDRQRGSGLPTQFLHQLVAVSDRATHELLSGYLDNSAELINKVRSEVETTLSGAKRAVTNPLDFFRALIPAQAGDLQHANEEIANLRKRIEELEAQLDAKPRKTTARRKRATKHS